MCVNIYHICLPYQLMQAFLQTKTVARIILEYISEVAAQASIAHRIHVWYISMHLVININYSCT